MSISTHHFKRLIAHSSALVIAMATLLMASPAIVEASCVPNRSAVAEYSDEGYDYGIIGGADGVRSTIETYNPYVPCGGFSYSWVMLTHHVASRWAQFGPKKACQGLVAYAQWNNNGDLHDLDLAIGPNTSYEYKVTYTAGQTFNYRFWRDGGNLLNVHLDWAPDAIQVLGERWIRSTQMMGDPGNHQSFSGTNQREYGNWYGFTGTAITNSYSRMTGGYQNFDIWDIC